MIGVGGWSLRRRLLVGILVPVLALLLVHAVSLYHEALKAVNTAYDRTLLASAKVISEQLDVRGEGDDAVFSVRVPYAALEAFETDNRSRLYYKVSALSGEVVSGYADLPAWAGQIPLKPDYAALVEFYDDHYRGRAVRVAAVLQPVASPQGQGMALIQVAETLELRQVLAKDVLLDTVWRQALLVLVVVWVVVSVVQKVTLPVRRLSHSLAARSQTDLTPLDVSEAPREIQPLVQATNGLMAKLDEMVMQQKQFVRDTSHQLRTPLAVLKVQVQSAQRGDLPPQQALQDIAVTVDRATRMANQMLSMAKVDQVKLQANAQPQAWDQVLRAVAMDMAPLVADKALDFNLHAEPVQVLAHEWMLTEMARNLLSNAVKYTPRGGALDVSLVQTPPRADDGAVRWVQLVVRNDGPSWRPEQLSGVLEPFAASASPDGAGLGLAICQRIVESLGGRLLLANWAAENGRPRGVAVTVLLPRAT